LSAGVLTEHGIMKNKAALVKHFSWQNKSRVARVSHTTVKSIGVQSFPCTTVPCLLETLSQTLLLRHPPIWLYGQQTQLCFCSLENYSPGFIAYLLCFLGKGKALEPPKLLERRC